MKLKLIKIYIPLGGKLKYDVCSRNNNMYINKYTYVCIT